MPSAQPLGTVDHRVRRRSTAPGHAVAARGRMPGDEAVADGGSQPSGGACIRDWAEANGMEPLFVSRSKTKGSQSVASRMKDHRVWKIVRAIGERTGIPELYPHAFRHSCGVALLRRSGGNLRAVQEHLCTRLTQYDLQKVASTFHTEGNGERDSRPPAAFQINLVAPAGFDQPVRAMPVTTRVLRPSAPDAMDRG